MVCKRDKKLVQGNIRDIEKARCTELGHAELHHWLV